MVFPGDKSLFGNIDSIFVIDYCWYFQLVPGGKAIIEGDIFLQKLLAIRGRLKHEVQRGLKIAQRLCLVF